MCHEKSSTAWNEEASLTVHLIALTVWCMEQYGSEEDGLSIPEWQGEEWEWRVRVWQVSHSPVLFILCSVLLICGDKVQYYNTGRNGLSSFTPSLSLSWGWVSTANLLRFRFRNIGSRWQWEAPGCWFMDWKISRSNRKPSGTCTFLALLLPCINADDQIYQDFTGAQQILGDKLILDIFVRACLHSSHWWYPESERLAPWTYALSSSP